MNKTTLKCFLCVLIGSVICWCLIGFSSIYSVESNADKYCDDGHGKDILDNNYSEVK